MFGRLLTTGRLGHGYFFFGESGNAMRRFTKSFAAYIERNSWTDEGGTLLDAEFREGMTSSGIDEARTIAQFLSGKPFRATRRTIVIYDIHELTVHAQNAILKIAEEPPPHALILMTALHSEAVIPALASRFQKFYVSSAGEAFVPDEDSLGVAQQILAEQGRRRADILKAALEDKDPAPLVYALLHLLRKDITRNARTIKALLFRWTAMNQWNTNRRLQIEAALNSH